MLLALVILLAVVFLALEASLVQVPKRADGRPRLHWGWLGLFLLALAAYGVPAAIRLLS